MVNSLILIVAVSLLSGCISLINGLTQEVRITSTPTGALVEINGARCITPCTMRIKRSSDEATLYLTPDGYPSFSEKITPSSEGPSWYQEIALLEGYAVIPALIDLTFNDLLYNWPAHIHTTYKEPEKRTSTDLARAYNVKPSVAVRR